MAEITEFSAAINQICSERGIDPDRVYEAIEAALLAAYKKDYGGGEAVKAEIDRDTGEVHIIADKTVVEEVTDEDTQISLEDAKKYESNLKVGDHLEIELQLEGFGRIAAQTAKQVILQQLRESEKDAVVEEFKEKVGTVVSGIVQRMMGPTAVVEMGKATAHMPPEEQIPNEFYKIGERYKFLLKEILDNQNMVVSRGSPEFLLELFRLEVPEIESGTVEIKAVAREAGSRSKVAVQSHQEGVDPIGSCVGQKGIRIANIMSELGEEKIDIIEWAEEESEFVAKALGPAQVEKVEVEDDTAKVSVSDDQLSLAIGKDGQNVRLAAKLTGFKIDITSPSLKPEDRVGTVSPDGETAEVEFSTRIQNALDEAGLKPADLLEMSEEEILDIKGIGKTSLEEITDFIESMKRVEEVSEEAVEVEGETETEGEEADAEEPGKKESDESEEESDQTEGETEESEDNSGESDDDSEVENKEEGDNSGVEGDNGDSEESSEEESEDEEKETEE